MARTSSHDAPARFLRSERDTQQQLTWRAAVYACMLLAVAAALMLSGCAATP